ncbi:hypothetical protein EG328_003214 [Venturia inaequalis]|uniref:Uncharacterized protein n=1 Tax=Venturia inaequalis TaxID=5025 RepID=A0A8H3UTB7_VENIN|nr:hypothetical protein EG328_003214 [Venturia inaequalis]
MTKIDKLRALTGLASMSAKVATVLFRFALEADPLRAGTDARVMGKEMSSLSSVLTYLVSVLSTEEKSHALHYLQLIERMNMRLLDMFADILDYPTYPRPLEPMPVGNCFRWAFDEPEMRLLRATIESYRITLSLLVATVEQSGKPSSWRQFEGNQSSLDEEEQEQDRAIILGLTYTRQASFLELCDTEKEVNAYGHPGMPHVVPSLDSGNIVFHPLGSQSLIELLGQTGLELQAFKSKWYDCLVSTGEHVSAPPLAERRTSSLLVDLIVKLSVLPLALKAIAINKASTPNLVRLKRNLGNDSRLFPSPISPSSRDAHLAPLTTAESEPNGISENWVDLSINIGYADANIVPPILDGKCDSGSLVLPGGQGITPAQKQQELELSLTAAREKKSILQEALRPVKVAVCRDSAKDFMEAIEKHEENSLLLEENEDLFPNTEDGRQLNSAHLAYMSRVQELRMEVDETVAKDQGH